jgi:hypothetical protein
LLSPHQLHLAFGPDDAAHLVAYRDFCVASTTESRGDLRMAINQCQPIGNDRFYREIESVM